MELDRSKIKLLASDTRADIIKSLSERRKTLTELSNELCLAPSSMTEQLKKLEDGGLVRKVDEKHKWKYYELTSESKDITSPSPNIFVVLSTLFLFLAVAAFFGSAYFAPGNVASDPTAQKDAMSAPSPNAGYASAESGSVKLSLACVNETLLVRNDADSRLVTSLSGENASCDVDLEPGETSVCAEGVSGAGTLSSDGVPLGYAC
ncbi:MAG: winged helix-turn-helix transcriptional regulator [Candidatus Diapherotrites archaeon]|nr:winged helix-turn-helix transcriptional regulator [Candidatus Diapherotrites archaeon]